VRVAIGAGRGRLIRFRRPTADAAVSGERLRPAVLSLAGAPTGACLRIAGAGAIA
jgi:hypothetical protein